MTMIDDTDNLIYKAQYGRNFRGTDVQMCILLSVHSY